MKSTKETIFTILLVISLVFLAILSCKPFAQVGSPLKPMDKASTEEKEEYINDCVSIIDVKHNGVTHEYVATGGRGGNRLIVGGHWKECKYCKENNSYHDVKTNFDDYANQVIVLLQAKDEQIEASEAVIKAYNEYLKMNNLIKN